MLLTEGVNLRVDINEAPLTTVYKGIIALWNWKEPEFT